MSGGRKCLYASKGGFRESGRRGLLNKPGFLPLKGEKKENQKCRKASLNAEYPASCCSSHGNLKSREETL